LKPNREGKRRRHDDHEWLSSQTNKQRETKRNKQTAIAFEEVHYGAGISRVYNDYLKSGSKQKLEKQTPYLEEIKRKEGKQEKRSYRVRRGRRKKKREI